jgi:hypothetical protein
MYHSGLLAYNWIHRFGRQIMTRTTHNRMLTVCLTGLVTLVSGALYAALADKGSLSGQVLGEDGKPLVGLALRLERTDPAGAGGGGKQGRFAGFDSGARGLQSPTEKGVTIVGRTTTDKDGNFIFKNVSAGAAILVGGSKNQGWIYYPVVIEADKEVKLGQITLAKTD